MASALEDFKKTIKETIAGNKLSASRVDKVKAVAARCFDRAPLARSEFLRLHLKAPSSSKIVSLYLFDAIVRHAREVIKKDGAGHDPVEILPSVAKAADPRAAFVTAAKDFLREMSTIVEDITTDVAARVKPEQREKVEKVIEIWRKAGAFDDALLNKAAAAAKAAGASTSSSSTSSSSSVKKDHSKTTRSTTPPYSPPPHLKRLYSSTSTAATPPMPPPASNGPPGLPSSLAALLGGPSEATPPSDPTQSFMNSLSSLVAQGGSNGTSGTPAMAGVGSSIAATNSATPAFDISQLSALQALQNFTVPSSTTPSTNQPPPSAPPGPPPQPSPSIQYPPQTPADPSQGDLSSLDFLSYFDPTSPQAWLILSHKWFNTYGYWPSVPEMGLGFLMMWFQNGGGGGQNGNGAASGGGTM